MYDCLPEIRSQLLAGRPVAMATVVRRRGSLPMANDAKLLMFGDGSFEGTVGGGCLEAEVYAIGMRLLAEGGASLDEFHLNEVEEGAAGHVCGGTATVFTRAFMPDAETLAFFERAVAAQDLDAPLLVATRLSEASPAHALVVDGSVDACLGETDPGAVPTCVSRRTRSSASEGWFVERVEPAPLLIVFGAGHCGVALGAAATAAGFRVWMLEDRPPFLAAGNMPWAERLRRVDFGALPELPLRRGTSLAIVTRGHEHDLTVLRQVMGAPVDYLGMIGSRRKKLLFREILAGEGADLEAFDRLSSPMGLDIGAETPAEIAASVVAELIAVRRAAAGAQDELPAVAADATR
jgi:xanthine dehydrogenase accessory factor